MLGANCHAILSGKGQTRAVPLKIVPCQAFSLQQGKPMTAHSSFFKDLIFSNILIFPVGLIKLLKSISHDGFAADDVQSFLST